LTFILDLCYLEIMKLQQGQIWKTSNRYIRIVTLERLSVDYKMMETLGTKDGTHETTTKKQFCRLIKGAELVLEETDLT